MLVEYHRNLRGEEPWRQIKALSLLEKNNLGRFSVGYLTQICELNIRKTAGYIKHTFIKTIFWSFYIAELKLTLHQCDVARLCISKSTRPHNPLHGTTKLWGCCFSSWRLNSAPVKGINHFHTLFDANLVSSDKQRLTIWNKSSSALTFMDVILFTLCFVCQQFFPVFTFRCCLSAAVFADGNV